MQCRAAAGVAVLGWLVLVVDALPGAELLHGLHDLKLVCVGAVSTLSLLTGLRCSQRPVEEVFDAGREYERRVVLRELNRPGNVTPIRRAPRGLSAFNRQLTRQG